ncbi:MAG: hypothetical protein ACW98D_06955 [Promethearchaeota archaeon]
MREHKCFRCGKILDFDSYIKNFSQKEKEELTHIWNSDYIEFYCCNCYVFKIKYQPHFDDSEFSYY